MARRIPRTRGAARALLALALASGGLLASWAADRPRTAAELLEGVQGWLDGTTDLEGRFEQQLASGALGAGLEEHGRFWVKRPGRMRWDYMDPERKVALVDGDRTWLWLEEEGQLMLGRLEEQGRLLPTLLAGTERLDASFDASIRAQPRRPGGTYQLDLVPHGEDPGFEHVTLLVRPPRYAIEAAEVLDAAGNRVIYVFTDLRRNRGVRDDVFHIDPPEDTLVLGEH